MEKFAPLAADMEISLAEFLVKAKIRGYATAGEGGGGTIGISSDESRSDDSSLSSSASESLALSPPCVLGIEGKRIAGAAGMRRLGFFLPFLLRLYSLILFFFSALILVTVRGLRLVPFELRDLTEDICELRTVLTDRDRGEWRLFQ